MGQDYVVPPFFDQDLFKVLGDKRPDFQWLIVGPKRSGSTFHIDPNATSAWNAVIRGSKRWILYPPHLVPPGVFPSADKSQVTSPVSLAEWFMNYYDPEDYKKGPAIECVCHQGEMLFVPQQWWHCVMNLQDSIAITQNFVNEQNLGKVLDFLENKPEQVSGYCHSDLYQAFTQGLAEHDPALLKQVKPKKPKVWQGLKSEEGFKFSFGS